MKDKIRIRGAKQHNLKDLNIDLPRRSFIVITGPSGSGKSSLAFDTVYAEGQRRYVESLSTYAKQFLERMEKPLVDRVDGISPAVAIEQQNPTKTSRSTVGTATEVYDYLRLLWARSGRTYCPGLPGEEPCGREIRPDTVEGSIRRIRALPAGTRLRIAFPLPLSSKLTHGQLVENLRALGFLRVLVGGEDQHLDDLSPDIDLTHQKPLLVVVDRLRLEDEEERDEREGRGTRNESETIDTRLADSLQTAFTEGEGEALAITSEGETLRFTEHLRCPLHPQIEFPTPTPQLFSFNNPYGSCPECTGFGAVLRYDPALIIPNSTRTLREGAVDPWDKPRYESRRKHLAEFARKHGVSLDVPWQDLPESFRNAVLTSRGPFQGVYDFLEVLEGKRYKQYIRVFLRQYQSAQECPHCRGTKLRPSALWVKVKGRNIADISALPLYELRPWIESLSREQGDERIEGVKIDPTALSAMESSIAEPIIRELSARVGFLNEVGLGYLTLDRQMRTLSGGEAQRITLSNSLGARLMDTLYVLDEPTIGLHPADNHRLLRLLVRLRQQGNTVLVVEHDPEAMKAADYLLEIGPGSGEMGGEVVFQGTLEEMKKAGTLTGRYLSGEEEIELPRARRTASEGGWLRLHGAREHNLKDANIAIPLGTLSVVTGVSGSGKSTLVHDILYRALEQFFSGGETSAKLHLGETVGAFDRMEGAEHLEGVVLVDQSPIGRTPRSNPVTYIKAYDEVRRIFASLPEAKARNLTSGHFSFNVEGGRCPVCKGEGQVQVEMVFMADVFIPCEMCQGKRFKPEVLEVRYKGKNVAEVLELTVNEALRFFVREDRLGQALWHLKQVGLGYLRLGQPAPTLSGGEAQRIKIARELSLSSRRGGKKVYILDEPTTGLHLDDIKTLLGVLEQLVDQGHTVLLIEHNLDVIKTADWLIDLGPGPGPAGGEVVAEGTPEYVSQIKESLTGRYLLPLLAEHAKRDNAKADKKENIEDKGTEAVPMAEAKRPGTRTRKAGSKETSRKKEAMVAKGN